VIGISNEPIATIQDFIEDQGITFPVLHDNSGVYSSYNLPGSSSPYPRDFILDANGVVRLAKHEYEPGVMISLIESLLGNTTGIIETETPLNPQSPVLLSIYPNPFNPDAKIRIDLKEKVQVSLSVLDVRGRVVDQLMRNERLAAGHHLVTLDGRDLSSGVYIVLLETAEEQWLQKIIKLK